MSSNRSLLIVNSVYHLLTAVHIKKNMLRDSSTDLLVTDITPQLKEYVPRLKETGLFERVIFGSIRDLNRKYATGTNEHLSEGFQNAKALFRWVLDEELPAYSEIYFANFDAFTRMLACRFYDTPCEFICYEDGFSSYVIDYLRKERAPINQHPDGQKIKEKVKRVYLYEPHLAMRHDHLINLPLPKIRRDDLELRELLNYIFAYQKPEHHADFIFLEQSFRAEGIKSNDIDLIRECQHTVGTGRFVVKPHPRNGENLSFELGLTRRYPSNAPWELFLLNEDPKNLTVITVCSNAALTGKIVFGLDLNTVMLYPLFRGKVLWKEDAILKRYLCKFRRQFAGDNYYVPETVYELRNILSYLGRRV